MSAVTPTLRSLPDRIRQVTLFELGGLFLITPPFMALSDTPALEAYPLLALMALIAALWNGVYCTAFDWIEGRTTGRQADQRSSLWRVIHALALEAGLVLLTLPLIQVWTGMDWLTALWADLGLALAYTAYAWAFNLAYDHLFPIQTGSGT